ncbi:hypothetical protein BP6252_07787 [Coleophoma cylindrospora]|uniref:TMEM205-like domain-containing protein n=1 Tax=Coleophoma cylindrospora TaxID=1849047 RepID=A0A3D8RBI4_9HELO|nr:hypothetical protein BP6252_07787 [Coleophoma cylindrospora]
MPDLSIFKTPSPYHLLAYGTLLGTQVFQTFVGGIVAYQVLPRPQFASLQQNLFPIYFSMQTALPAVLALTYPGSLLTGTASGLKGTFQEINRWSVLLPVATMILTSLVNFAVVGPATTKIMRERKHQETRDGKKSYDPAPHSKEMIALNKSFGSMHGISSLLNMAGFIATVWYGVTLSSRVV